MMLAFLAALAGPAAPAIDTRIAEAAAEAQALHGPLDGAWTLRDRQGRVLFFLELVDPVGAGPDLQGAWRDPGRPAADGIGVLAAARRAPDGPVLIAWATGGTSLSLVLRRSDLDHWRGQLRAGRVRRGVTLERR